jgi:hypothetical protein
MSFWQAIKMVGTVILGQVPGSHGDGRLDLGVCLGEQQRAATTHGVAHGAQAAGIDLARKRHAASLAELDHLLQGGPHLVSP